MDSNSSVRKVSQPAPLAGSNTGNTTNAPSDRLPSASAAEPSLRPVLGGTYDSIQRLHASGRSGEKSEIAPNPAATGEPSAVINIDEGQSVSTASLPNVVAVAPAQAIAPAPLNNTIGTDDLEQTQKIKELLFDVELIDEAKHSLEEGNFVLPCRLVPLEEADRTYDNLKFGLGMLTAEKTLAAQSSAILFDRNRNPAHAVTYDRIRQVFDQAAAAPAPHGRQNVEVGEAIRTSASQPLFADSALCDPNSLLGKVNQMDGNFLAAKHILQRLNEEMVVLRRGDVNDVATKSRIEVNQSMATHVKLALEPLKHMSSEYLEGCRDRVKGLKNGPEADLAEAKNQLSAAQQTHNRLHIEDTAIHLVECQHWKSIASAIAHEAVPQAFSSATHLGAIRSSIEEASTSYKNYINQSVHVLSRISSTGIGLGLVHFAVSEAVRPILVAGMQFVAARKPTPIAADKLYPDTPIVRYENGQLSEMTADTIQNSQDAIKQTRLSLKRLQDEAKFGTLSGDGIAYASFALAHGLRIALGFPSIGARALASGIGGGLMATGHNLKAMLHNTTEIPHDLQVLRPDIKTLPTHELSEQRAGASWKPNKKAIVDGLMKLFMFNPESGRWDTVVPRALVTKMMAGVSGISLTAGLDMIPNVPDVPKRFTPLTEAARGVGNAVGFLLPFYSGTTADAETAGAIKNSANTGIDKNDPLKGTKTAWRAITKPNEGHVLNLSRSETSRTSWFFSGAYNLFRHALILPQQATIELPVKAVVGIKNAVTKPETKSPVGN